MFYKLNLAGALATVAKLPLAALSGRIGTLITLGGVTLDDGLTTAFGATVLARFEGSLSVVGVKQ